MSDVAAMLNTLRRPKILIRAARAGVIDYRRERDLKKLIRQQGGTCARKTIDTLLAEEHRLETTRTSGDGSYNLHRHITLLTAIIAEARMSESVAMAA